jgi:LmeA-like phospholipid-binding
VITVAILAAFFAALLVADRVALIYAANRVARQIQDQGFLAKPQVSIAGFPFLTQVAARRLDKVVVSAVGRKLGPVEVKRFDVTLSGIRVSSRYHVRAASEVSGTALIGFAGLAGLIGLPAVTVAADGPDQVKIRIGPGNIIGTATARVTPAAPSGIRLVVISANGIPMAVLGPLRDIKLRLPALPQGTTIQDVSVTDQGVLMHFAGQNVSLSGDAG